MQLSLGVTSVTPVALGCQENIFVSQTLFFRPAMDQFLKSNAPFLSKLHPFSSRFLINFMLKKNFIKTLIINDQRFLETG